MPGYAYDLRGKEMKAKKKQLKPRRITKRELARGAVRVPRGARVAGIPKDWITWELSDK